jgi:cation diffusion facilitator family transporter
MSPHAHKHAHDHVHDHAHDHAHGHAHDADEHPAHAHAHGEFTPREARQAKRLGMVLGLIAVFFAFELAGAIAAHSVVLQADALHLLMDVLALSMSLLAMRIAVRRPTPRFTFGMRRAEPVAAIFNSGLVLVATAEIVREGIEELRGSGEPRATIMLVVAGAALVVNGISAWLIHGALHGHAHGHDHHHAEAAGAAAGKQHGHALNLRGAWLHLLGDALGSIAALVAAVVIKMGGSVAVDAIASFIVAAILVASACRLVRDATLVLLEAAPPHVPVGAVREVILAFEGIASVHDLHVWTLGAGHDAITTHVLAVKADATLAHRLSRTLRETFDCEYVTVQVESPDEECDKSEEPT